MSDRMAVMMDGDILQIGKPSEVYESPNSVRVAEFVGSPKINILSCSCNANGKIQYNNVTLKNIIKGQTARKIFIGIRPEHLILQIKPSNDCLKGKLFYKENLGSDIFLHVSMNDGRDGLIARVSPHAGQMLSIGDTLYFTCEQSKIIVFDDKGHRISMQVTNDERRP